MPSTKLPPEHSLIRYVKWSQLLKDQNDPEKAVGVLGEAFRLRPATETRPAEEFLSATWLEYFPGSADEKVKLAVWAIRASKLTPTKKSGFAIGEISEISDSANKFKHSIRVLHEPEDDNKAHVAVRRWPAEEIELFELLAIGAWSKVVLNSEIPPGNSPAPNSSDWHADE